MPRPWNRKPGTDRPVLTKPPGLRDVQRAAATLAAAFLLSRSFEAFGRYHSSGISRQAWQIVGAAGFIVAYGLWRNRPWSREAVLLGVLAWFGWGCVWSFDQPSPPKVAMVVVMGAILLYVVWYLYRSKAVVAYYRATRGHSEP